MEGVGGQKNGRMKMVREKKGNNNRNTKGESGIRNKRGKNKGEEQRSKSRERSFHVSIYSMRVRSPITLQVSSWALGGFDRSGSPW